MKKKLIALLAAVAMVFSLAACGSTPDSVGTIGTVDITSGLYLLAQYDAYQKAADLATSEQDATDVKAFLKQTITVDADSGETATVSDYVSQKTMENLETYAAIETRFEELGGQLTAEEEAQADSYASQLMEQYGDTYKANGIGLNTVQRFERILIKSSDLLELVYGVDGETPVSDADLTSHLENNMYELAYYTIPLYNTSTYASADEDQTSEMLDLVQDAVDQTNAYAASLTGLSDSDFSSALLGYFSSVVTSALPEDGETPVSDADLTSHLENNMYELAYYTIPLYNTSTYASADEDQTSEMLDLVQDAVDQTNAYAASLTGLSDSDFSSALLGYFSSVVTSALPEVYAVLGSTYSSDSNAPSLELIGDSTMTSAFTAEGSADTIRGLSIGQAAAVKYNSYALMAALRLDPLSLKALDDLRGQVLNDMKGEELSEALTAYGASLEHNLSSSAMNRMPASKIVNSSTN